MELLLGVVSDDGGRAGVVEASARRRADEGGFRVSRALAKTITFRGFGTVIDFTTNLIVVGDLATATGLSAVGFVVGPFVYIGHEKVWERIRARWGRDSAEQPQADLATVPAAG